MEEYEKSEYYPWVNDREDPDFNKTDDDMVIHLKYNNSSNNSLSSDLEHYVPQSMLMPKEEYDAWEEEEIRKYSPPNRILKGNYTFDKSKYNFTDDD